MSDLLTICEGPGKHSGDYGFAHWGRLTREEAVAKTRAQAERDLAALQRFLSTPDAELHVRVVRGSHVQRLVQEL
jgi:hypothetical protein